MQASAAKLAYATLDADPAAALRRALIICAEDTMLQPDFSVVTWLMIAHSKGFALTPDAKALLVGFMAHCAQCPLHDTLLGGDAAMNASVAAAVAKHAHFVQGSATTGAGVPLAT